MACRGVLFAITNEQAEQLRAARGNDSTILSIVQDEIEERWDEEHLCQTDKAWDAIHRCLADGTLRNGNNVLSLCILGGEQLHHDINSYVVSLVTPAQVRQVAEALRPLNKEWFRAQYFSIDPSDYGVPGMPNEEDFEYTWDYFGGVRKFYEKAANEDRYVIFSVDQ